MKFKTHMVFSYDNEGFTTLCGITDGCSEKFYSCPDNLSEFGDQIKTSCKKCLKQFEKMLTAHDTELKENYLTLSIKEIEIISHSLGIEVYRAKMSNKARDKKLPKEFYRNCFCAGESHDDWHILESLAKQGYMAQGQKINEGRDTLWYVTDEGIEQFRKCFKFIVSPTT